MGDAADSGLVWGGVVAHPPSMYAHTRNTMSLFLFWLMVSW
jgi:hypothetical protein